MDITKTTCPRCHQPIDKQAITCPYCHVQLKAYGHPGITLHRASGDQYLCDSCIYHADDSCNFPQRPYAKECTLYQNIEERELELQQLREANSFLNTVKNWIRRNQPLLLLLTLLLVCLIIAMLQL